MIGSIVYLDHNATTPMHREVREAMEPYLGGARGNASSMHALGREALRAIDRAREQVARLINAEPDEIIFVSGGTESDNMALQGAARARQDHGKHLLVSALEHPAVRRTAQALQADGWDADTLEAGPDGRVDPVAAVARVRPFTSVVSVMYANNETGVIQPVSAISARLPEPRPYLHCDAVQAAGKIPIDVAQLGVDLLSLSAHKMHGPQGIGALYLRTGTDIEPLLHGGSQENGLRPGTCNTAAIVGFGKAAELARRSLSEDAAYVAALRDDLEAAIVTLVPDATVIGRGAERLPNTSNIAFPGHDNHELAAALDQHGIAVATGSACASGSSTPSHVHAAMGLSAAMSRSALRFSLGPDTSEESIARTLNALRSILG